MRPDGSGQALRGDRRNRWRGLPGVLKGMSCGLKPVVHTFPAA